MIIFEANTEYCIFCTNLLTAEDAATELTMVECGECGKQHFWHDECALIGTVLAGGDLHDFLRFNQSEIERKKQRAKAAMN